MIALFRLDYADGWDRFFAKMDKSQQARIWKKIQSLKTRPSARHLKKGVPFFVLETGQYRICFEEKGKARIVMFAGTHKQYEKWLSKQ